MDLHDKEDKKAAQTLAEPSLAREEAPLAGAARTSVVGMVHARRSAGITGRNVVQFHGAPARPAAQLHALAEQGLRGNPGALPHLDAIQRSFGSHDISNVEAHVGGHAAQANRDIGARAYATGNSVAFRDNSPDLHTAAHEAAHIIQQRAGVHLKDGLGQSGDPYERHADEVADAVVAGRSAQTILDQMAGPATAAHTHSAANRPVQRKEDPPRDPVAGADSAAGGVGAGAELQALLRELYQKADAAIAQEVAFMRSQGVPEDKIAKWSVEARNNAKTEIRKWDIAKAWAEQRNSAKYGNPVGPSYEQLRGGDAERQIKPRTDAQIADGASRSNATVDRWAGRLRIAGRILLVVDLGVSTYKVAVAPPSERPKVLAREIASTAGGAAGCWGGGKLGAAGGAFVGGPIGAGVGAVGGCIAGAWAGSKAAGAATEWLIDELYPPTQTGFEQ